VFERFAPDEAAMTMTDEAFLAEYAGVPVEPMLLMLGITIVLLLLAGRIWQEVEA
jgi:hypothetical protein